MFTPRPSIRAAALVAASLALAPACVRAAPAAPGSAPPPGAVPPNEFLSPAVPQPLTGFGTSCAASGEFIAVGEPQGGPGGNGAVHVFRRDPMAGIVEEAFIPMPAVAGAGAFGSAVAIGSDRLAVGAPGAPGSALPGRVLLYRRQPQGVWTLTQVLSGAWCGQATAGTVVGFGREVRLAGNRLLVSAPDGSVFQVPCGTPAFMAGCAFLYQLNPQGQFAPAGQLPSELPETSVIPIVAEAIDFDGSRAALTLRDGASSRVLIFAVAPPSLEAVVDLPAGGFLGAGGPGSPGSGPVGGRISLLGDALAVGQPAWQGSGRVAIFREAPKSGWFLEALLGQSDGGSFGTSVALGPGAESTGVLVATAPDHATACGSADGAAPLGEAFVFRVLDGIWTELQPLQLSEEGKGEQCFGMGGQVVLQHEEVLIGAANGAVTLPGLSQLARVGSFHPVTDCNGDGIPDSQIVASNPGLDCNRNGLYDLCEILGGAAQDDNANFVPDSCEFALGDFNLDGAVSGADLGIILGAWGTGGGPTDLNHDGVVDGADLGIVLANWGATFPPGFCGNGIPEPGESCANCPEDVPCPPDAP